MKKEVAGDVIRVPKGNYTDYLNEGHQVLINSLNNLKESVIIGTDVKIKIESSLIEGEPYIILDRETNPAFLKNFTMDLQRCTFKNDDSGAPGSMTLTCNYPNQTRFDVYLTRNYAEDHYSMFYNFNTLFNSLVAGQYTSVSGYYGQTGRVLSISAPVCHISVFFGDKLFVKYRNVKFSSPVFQGGTVLENNVLVFQYSFSYSYLTYDL